MKRYTSETTAQKRGLSLGMRCLLLLVLVVSVGVFASKMLTYHRLSDESEKLKEKKHALEERIEEIQHNLDGVIDYDEIVRIAREKFKLAFPEDTVYYNGQGENP